jgi:hypothetical protein
MSGRSIFVHVSAGALVLGDSREEREREEFQERAWRRSAELAHEEKVAEMRRLLERFETKKDPR